MIIMVGLNIKKKKGVTVYHKPTGAAVPILKGEGNIAASIEKIVEVIRDIDGRPQWDMFSDGGGITQKFSEDGSGLGILKFKGQWTVWPRDFAVIIIKRKLDDGSILCIASSIVHPSFPEVSGYVRGNLMASGFHIKSISNDPEKPKCSITYIVQVDIKGWVPTQVSDMVNLYQPLAIIGLRKVTLLSVVIDINRRR